jgi:hypothetical protein
MTTRPVKSPTGRQGAKPGPAGPPDHTAIPVSSPLSKRPLSKRRLHPEEDLQRQVVRFLQRSLTGNSLVFHVPNGGRRGFLEALRFKSMGVLAGMVDLGIVTDGRLLGIELKAGRGQISDAQAWCHRRLRAAGAPVYVCRSLDEVIAVLQQAGVPMCVEGRFL